MNIILVPRRSGKTNAYRLNSVAVYFSLFVLLALFATFAGGGYFIAKKQGTQYTPSALIDAWKKELLNQREDIDIARQASNDNLDALAVRLGRLQAQVMRLDALGDRLTVKAKLDKGEFDFTQQPAQGGPVDVESTKSKTMSIPDFVTSLNALSQQLENRAQQLGLLETMMMSHSLQDEVVPAGRPITSGWLSSNFGIRTDPFSGHKVHHNGVDFAGKMGSNVVAVASGVVTWASSRYGYGNLVEINHGNGYSTRYGHCKEILVVIGDTIKKGQTLALMGSTGRSTGPHVHFEVLYKGKAVDPIKYIKNKKVAYNQSK